MNLKSLAAALSIGLAVSASPAFAGGVPVIDLAAIAKFTEQITQLNAQLDNMKQQLQQAQQLNASLTGGRGMEGLLAGELRNVIPTNWQETLAQMNGGAKISDLAQSIKDNARKVDSETLAALPDDLRKGIEALANTAASEQASAGQVYDNASQRFSRLQALMDAIPQATDLKAIADLQARIQVEQTMLQNEAIKMQALAQASAAQRQIEARQAAEVGLIRDTGTQQWSSVLK